MKTKILGKTKMKAEFNKIYVFLLVTIGFVMAVQTQNEAQEKPYRIVQSNIGMGGTSKTVSTASGKYRVSQSIGQSSVIGTYSKSGYYLRQGYQQPHAKIKVQESNKNQAKAKIYPNPFNQQIFISFDEKTTDNIYVSIYDVAGKLIYFKDFSPSKTIKLNIENLSNGAYLLKATSNGKLFNAKLIKI